MDQDIVMQELLPGEKLLWAGRPDQGVIFSRSDYFSIPFSIILFAFAVFWWLNAIKMYPGIPREMGLLFITAGALLVIAALYYMIGRFFYRVFARSRTWYAVTDKRVIILKNVVFKNIRSISFDKMEKVEKFINPAGKGTIIFGDDKRWTHTNVNTLFNPSFGTNQPIIYNSTGSIKAPAFYDIEDAEKVYGIIMRSKAF